MAERDAGPEYRVGVDENGLGARLGPLIVSAVLARVDAAGARTLSRRLPKRVAADLDDSKRLVSHGDFALGEAWARVLAGEAAATPEALFASLSLEGEASLREPCPSHVERQCWSCDGEGFGAPDDVVERVRRHRDFLATRGVEIVAVRSSVVCTKRLNQARERGVNRFVADLHAMERLVLSLGEHAGSDVSAVCGKVGGMADYSRFFGPLAGWLHAEVEKRPACSRYRFPGLGEIAFVRDADARDPLVMLASLIGKYVRELLMARVARFYGDARPSGYSDPVTARFVEASALARQQRRVPDVCFERARSADG